MEAWLERLVGADPKGIRYVEHGLLLYLRSWYMSGRCDPDAEGAQYFINAIQRLRGERAEIALPERLGSYEGTCAHREFLARCIARLYDNLGIRDSQEVEWKMFVIMQAATPEEREAAKKVREAKKSEERR
jgi:hypothetical protein